MGKVIPFSKIDLYLRSKKREPGFCPGTILDANVLVSATYEIKSDHEEVIQLLELLDEHEIACFSTVTTRSEVLDFHRRMTMTEALLDLSDRKSEWRLSERERAEIKTKQGLLRSRERRKPGTDPVFTDTDLKDIKRAFSAGSFSGHHGWLKLCEGFLKGRLEQMEEELLDRGVTYISQHDESQKQHFQKNISWSNARFIAERTCLGLSDAMILNASQFSRFSFIVSTDFDVGYAALADQELKDVVMPDIKVKPYRDYHFPK
jgi:hypothetical protein